MRRTPRRSDAAPWRRPSSLVGMPSPNGPSRSMMVCWRVASGASEAPSDATVRPARRRSSGVTDTPMTLDQLRRLQVLDDQIDAERERIATIEATVRDRSGYEHAQRRHQEAVAPVRQLEADQNDLDLRAGTARAQLADVEGKLY